LAGLPNFIPNRRKGLLTTDVQGGGDRQAFLWCRIEWRDGHYIIHVPERQSSGQNRCLPNVNAFLPIPVGIEKLRAGDFAEVILLD
jgi:molybdopterin molybdotransferase